MNRWRIHKENGRYIPKKKWFFFWVNIYLPTEIFCTLKENNYSFKYTEEFNSYGGHFLWYKPEFESINDAIHCIKMYDEYYKKEEDGYKIKDYYLNENYEVK